MCQLHCRELLLVHRRPTEQHCFKGAIITYSVSLYLLAVLSLKRSVVVKSLLSDGDRSSLGPRDRLATDNFLVNDV